MITFIDCLVLATVLVAPFLFVLYSFMLVVADSIITAIKNWNE